MPIKRHTVVGWIKKNNTSTYCPQETLKDTPRLKVEGTEKDTPWKSMDRLATLQSDFKINTVIRNKDITYHKGIKLVRRCKIYKYTCTQHRNTKGTPKYLEQILRDLKGDTESNMVTVDFNIPLSSVDNSSRRINTETLDLTHETTWT